MKDLRKIEKGSTCKTSKQKKYILDIIKKLGINIEKNINIDRLCDTIRISLIFKELEARYNKTNIKWFYFSGI